MTMTRAAIWPPLLYYIVSIFYRENYSVSRFDLFLIQTYRH